MTRSKDLDSSKTPIGVVVCSYSDGSGEAIALKSIGKYQWSISLTDIPELTNYQSFKDDPRAYINSCENTAIITAAGDSETYPAAWAAYEYSTEGTSPGNWCLPADMIITEGLHDNFGIIQQNILLAGGSYIVRSAVGPKEAPYWTSTEVDAKHAHALTFIAGYSSDVGDIGSSSSTAGDYKNSNEIVHPVIPFCKDGYEYDYTSFSCKKKITQAVWGQCTGYAKTCNIGDIVYSDGTCSPQKISDKTPIAVVVYKSSDGNCAQAMALNSLGEYAWGISSGIKDISALQNFPSPQDASQDFASCENTIIITSELPSKGNYPAAWEAYEYQTEGTKAGDWCLPAAGIMTSIYNNWGNISKGFSFAGGEQPNNEYWTSTESGSSYAYISMGNQSNYDYGTDSRPKESLNGVRPVIEF